MCAAPRALCTSGWALEARLVGNAFVVFVDKCMFLVNGTTSKIMQLEKTTRSFLAAPSKGFLKAFSALMQSGVSRRKENTRTALKSPRLIWLPFSSEISFLVVFHIKQEAQKGRKSKRRGAGNSKRHLYWP